MPQMVFLFCIKCDCSQKCCFFTGYILDVIFFLWCGIWGLANIGTAVNAFSVVFLIFTILFWIIVGFAVWHMIKQNSLTTEMVERYLKIRLWTIIAMAVCAVVCFLIYGIALGYWGGAVAVLITLGIDCAWLLGYTETIVNGTPGGAPKWSFNPLAK